MRVISQDGVFDIPYEICSVWCRGSAVMCYMSGDNTHTVLATYSNAEKAQKAMEMLREAYTGMPIVMQNIDISEDVAKEFERLKKCGVMVRAENQPSKIECISNAVFQFPAEEELE